MSSQILEYSLTNLKKTLMAFFSKLYIVILLGMTIFVIKIRSSSEIAKKMILKVEIVKTKV